MKQTSKNRLDALGDRMKSYEAITTGTTLMPNTPVYCRIDGRAFHTLTRGLDKPFDNVFQTLMQSTCARLVEATNAKLGYVQSDEISLGWEDFTKAPFEGKLFKLESVLASMATAFFYQGITKLTCEVADGNITDDKDIDSLQLLFKKSLDRPITFDCRIFNVPNMDELANAFLWRENDATRNSISMLAQSMFSHKELQKKSTQDMQNMMFEQKGVNWNELDPVLKRGMYLRRELYLEEISDEVWDKIPPSKRPAERKTWRSHVVPINFPIMRKCLNKVGAYFYGEDPILAE